MRMRTPTRVIGRRYYARHREQIIMARNTAAAKLARATYYREWWAKNGDDVKARRREKTALKRAARTRVNV